MRSRRENKRTTKTEGSLSDVEALAKGEVLALVVGQ